MGACERLDTKIAMVGFGDLTRAEREAAVRLGYGRRRRGSDKQQAEMFGDPATADTRPIEASRED